MYNKHINFPRWFLRPTNIWLWFEILVTVTTTPPKKKYFDFTPKGMFQIKSGAKDKVGCVFPMWNSGEMIIKKTHPTLFDTKSNFFLVNKTISGASRWIKRRCWFYSFIWFKWKCISHSHERNWRISWIYTGWSKECLS